MAKYFMPYTREWFNENGEQTLRHLERAIKALEKNDVRISSNYGDPWRSTWYKLKEAKELLEQVIKERTS